MYNTCIKHDEVTAYLFMLKLLSFAKRVAYYLTRKYNDNKRNRIYSNEDHRINTASSLSVNSLIDISKLNVADIDLKTADYLINRTLMHEFDLLGSGWVKVCYGMEARGFEGNKYKSILSFSETDPIGMWLSHVVGSTFLPFSRKLWRMVQTPYEPIDWQIDFKSGFRWDSKASSWQQRKLSKCGADIKVPWELSRMQHLPRIAVLSLVSPGCQEAVVLEFKNQVLDFMMSNPIGMGVNWTCTMDVAIRAANILLAYDILSQLDKSYNIFTDDFRSLFAGFIHAHGEFITNNLEWNNGNGRNHYLANVAGLLWISAYLRGELADSWLNFSIWELINEVLKQFNEDGSNIELSTSYHRLSGEMVVYSTALVYRLLKSDRASVISKCDIHFPSPLRKNLKRKSYRESPSFFPEAYIKRLFSMGCFTCSLTKPDNKIFQIGDNDSGHYFRLTPCGHFLDTNVAIMRYKNLIGYTSAQELYWDECELDHRAFVSALGGLIESDEFIPAVNAFPLESSLVRGLLLEDCDEQVSFMTAAKPTTSLCLPPKVFFDKKKLVYKLNTVISFRGFRILDLGQLTTCFYPDFGAYVIRTENFSLLAYIGNKNLPNGHAHNELISLQLTAGGYDLLADRGTYVYTAARSIRDHFRSVVSHNVPIVEDQEQNRFVATFQMSKDAVGQISRQSNQCFELYLTYKSVCHSRIVEIYPEKLIIQDSCNRAFTPNVINQELASISNGYGKLTYIK